MKRKPAAPLRLCASAGESATETAKNRESAVFESVAVLLAGKMPARAGGTPAEEEEGRSGGRWTGEPLPRNINRGGSPE